MWQVFKLIRKFFDIWQISYLRVYAGYLMTFYMFRYLKGVKMFWWTAGCSQVQCWKDPSCAIFLKIRRDIKYNIEICIKYNTERWLEEQMGTTPRTTPSTTTKYLWCYMHLWCCFWPDNLGVLLPPGRVALLHMHHCLPIHCYLTIIIINGEDNHHHH